MKDSSNSAGLSCPNCNALKYQQTLNIAEYYEYKCTNCGTVFRHISNTPIKHTAPLFKQTAPPTEGVKFDNDKPRTDLLPFDALEDISKVLAYGANKYAPRNWEKGMAWGRLLGAALRHGFRWGMGEDNDPESGLSHLSHMGCCVLMLSALVKRKVGTDDRFKP